MNDKPIALDAYEILAEAYASVIDTKPHNAYYERPATLSLLPDVSGAIRAAWFPLPPRAEVKSAAS